MSQKSKFEIKLFQEFWDKLEAIESKVDSMMQNDSHSKHQEWLNTKEAAKALGISTRKLQDLRNSSALPFSQFGRTIRYSTADIQDFLLQEFYNPNSRRKGCQ